MKNLEENFLETLLNETYQDTKSEELPITSSELLKYFKKKLNEVDHNSLSDYLAGHNLSTSELDYVVDLRCYRMNLNDQVLDFPENWSFFNELTSFDFVFIDKDYDKDMILDLFGEIIGKEVELLVIKIDGQALFVYLDASESKDHVEWMRTYLEKSKFIDKKKAA